MMGRPLNLPFNFLTKKIKIKHTGIINSVSTNNAYFKQLIHNLCTELFLTTAHKLLK